MRKSYTFQRVPLLLLLCFCFANSAAVTANEDSTAGWYSGPTCVYIIFHFFVVQNKYHLAVEQLRESQDFI